MQLLHLLLLASSVAAKTHVLNYTTSFITANPDGLFPKRMIAFNGEWPLPDIHVNKGDRVELYLTNGFDSHPTSIHFHGLLQNGSAAMDGPPMITQCEIMPGQTYLYNFTVDVPGTFWYHSYSGSQYTDGLRGAFVVHDDEPFEYDEEKTIFLTDYYHGKYEDVNSRFMSRYNPTGSEPLPQNLMLNNGIDQEIGFAADKTYLLRVINGGTFVSQYFFLEDHDLTVVEVDSVWVEPYTTDVLYLSVGQRVSVLVTAKSKPKGNYAMMQLLDVTMLDSVPQDLPVNRTHTVVYDAGASKAKEAYLYDWDRPLNIDNELTTLDKVPMLESDVSYTMDVKMEMLGDGVVYGFFNEGTFVAPKVPVLVTAMTSGELADNPAIYGDNINAYILSKDEVVEIVLNNYDDGRHPFHLHGHNFQVVAKSGEFEDPTPYNKSSAVFNEYPVVRDTVVVEPNGYAVIRFVANNPGVWIFHCHLDWHLEQGLAAVFIEDPLGLQQQQSLSQNLLDTCRAANIPTSGNAAGHVDDWFNMDGLPRQPQPLPEGFTVKGYIAMFISTCVAIYGLYSIIEYGLEDVIQDDEEVYNRIANILKEHGALPEESESLVSQ